MKTKLGVIIVLILAVTIFSCQHVMRAADVGAQIAGATGVIDPNVADAISVSARAIGTAAEEITPEQEYFIGRAVAANILTTHRLYNGNPALTAYLNHIAMAITINSPRPDIFNGYRVAIIDSNEINAFATPGGHILITRGLINAARSEDALAAVIAHEVAHIQLQHGIRAIRNNRITQAIMATSVAAVGAVTELDVNQLTDIFNESVGEIVHTMVHSGFSQAQEFEADNTAMALMAAAGYNPAALIEMLRSLPATTTGFGATHPTPAQRITNAERTVGSFRVADNSTHRQARFAATAR
ncbi:MAG: M48 family metalloprotease [Treponema sp.]|nr:M48 family metalloprotease [Treponema sp.]